MNDKPNITVIYQEPKPSSPSAGSVLLELLAFLALAFIIGGGCWGR